MKQCGIKDRWPEDQIADLTDTELAAFLEHARTCPYHALMKADIEAPWHQAFDAIPKNVLADMDICDRKEDPMETVARISALVRDGVSTNSANKERWLNSGAPVRGFAITDNAGNRVEVRIGTKSLTWDKSLDIPLTSNDALHLVKMADEEFPEIVLETFLPDMIPMEGYRYENKLPSGLTVSCELHQTENGWSVVLDYQEPEGQVKDGETGPAKKKFRVAGAMTDDFSFRHLAGIQEGGYMYVQRSAFVGMVLVVAVLAATLRYLPDTSLATARTLDCDAGVRRLMAYSWVPDRGHTGSFTTAGDSGGREPLRHAALISPTPLGHVEIRGTNTARSKQGKGITEAGGVTAQNGNHGAAPGTSKDGPSWGNGGQGQETGTVCRLQPLGTIRTLSIDSHVDSDLRNTMAEALNGTGRFKVASDDDDRADAHLKLAVIGGQVQAEIWIGDNQVWKQTCGCEALTGIELYRHAVPDLVKRLMDDTKEQENGGKQSAV